MATSGRKQRGYLPGISADFGTPKSGEYLATCKPVEGEEKTFYLIFKKLVSKDLSVHDGAHWPNVGSEDWGPSVLR